MIPPRAYALPRTADRLLEVLRHHGITLAAAQNASYPVERYIVETLRPSVRSERAPKTLALRVERISTSLADYCLAVVDAENARALTTFLEPASKYALHRFATLLSLRPGTVYPVLRVR